MRLVSRYGTVAVLMYLFSGLASAAPAIGCRQAALDQLRLRSPNGSAIYRQITDTTFFFSWIDCHEAQFDLSTAVHESTHFIVAETDAFPLVGGGEVARPHEVSAFVPPSRVADRFRDDDFVAIYLQRGKASSAIDFLYLLDELNAYSHDLATAVDLKDLTRPDEAVDHRDGLAALMAFVAVYAEMAKAGEPETWARLRAPATARTVAALWSGAERVMASACGIPNFGSKDRDYIRRTCAPEARSALAPILGRAPVCPVACLAPSPEVEPTDGDGAVEAAREEAAAEPAEADRPHRPFNIRIGPARHRLRGRELNPTPVARTSPASVTPMAQ